MLCTGFYQLLPNTLYHLPITIRANQVYAAFQAFMAYKNNILGVPSEASDYYKDSPIDKLYQQMPYSQPNVFKTDIIAL